MMAELLTFGEAVQHAGVSRQRLNRAIHSGRLAAERGGGPGKPTRIRFEDLRAWCASEGLSLPVEANVRLERAERSMPAQGLPPAPPPVRSAPKASVLQRLQAMQAEGLSLQAIANRLNAEGVPTLSGKGRWQKGTIGNLLAQG